MGAPLALFGRGSMALRQASRTVGYGLLCAFDHIESGHDDVGLNPEQG